MTREDAIEIIRKNMPSDKSLPVYEALETLIPELAESDDERIRKTLIDALKTSKSVGELKFILPEPTREECLAYLEKQGEQKVSVDDFKAKDWYVSKVDGKIHNIYYSVDKVKPKFKVGDKIIEKNFDECGRGTIIDIKDGKYIFDDGGFICIEEQGLWKLVEQKPAEYIKRNSKEWYSLLAEQYDKGFWKGKAEQKPAEWSEEDEAAWGDLMWCIEQARKSAKDENDMGNIWFAENWVKNRLKSLRPQPKQEQNDYITPHKEFFKFIYDRLINVYKENPNVDYMRSFKERLDNLSFEEKQEWNDEDEDMLNSCISSIEEAKENRYAYKETDGDTSYDREIDWLKSLRPLWKPTDEQIKALHTAAYIDGMDYYGGLKSKLLSLYEDLKKLM